MKLLYTSDLHGNRTLYEALLRRASGADIDAVVIGGDLCPRGGSTLKEWIAFQRSFLEEYILPLFSSFRGKHPDKKIFLIMGNDDFRKNMDVLEEAQRKGILHSLHKKKAEVWNGFSIVGYSFVNTTPFRLKDWEKKDSTYATIPSQLSPEVLRSCEEELGTIEEDLKDLAVLSDPGKTIYVIHAPPHGTNLDITTSGEHVGSHAIRAFIEKNNPLATLHGHIHESPRMSGSWMDVLDKTVCINVGSAQGNGKLPCCVMDIENAHLVSYEELEAHP